MDIVFVSDFFLRQVTGGAELADDCLIKYLVNFNNNVELCSARNTKFLFETIKSEKEYYYIVSNFTSLSEESKQALMTQKYSIYEHDHKYLQERNPSIYKDFLAPENRIINRRFYKNAHHVFCQSKLHAEVVEKNLKIENVVNLGCSIWHEQHLNSLRNAIGTEKVAKACILDSENSIKGKTQAIGYCKDNKVEYDLIGSSNFDEFVGQMAKYESLVFFPQVLESFCRLAIEARILGCKLVTNELLGCTSEEWFPEYKGEELLDFIQNKQLEVVSRFVELIKSDVVRKSEVADLTVVLNSYRRPYNLKMQIEAINRQTVRPKQIWLWVNAHEDNEGFDYSELGVDRIFNNDYNWKFYGRFAGALLADTEYLAIFDDDTIPGERWLENCLETMETNEGILGSAGIILNDKFYIQHDRCGWPTQNSEITRVDLVGHAWFFKREWLSHLWREKPTTWDNGEDIQFSYLAQKYGNIQTYCPPHPPEDKSLHGSVLGNELGIDIKATSTNQAISHQRFFNERDICIQTAIKGGWKTVKAIKA